MTLGATMHAPWEQPACPPKQPHMPPQSNHACPPEQPCTGATTHAYLPGATMHAPPQSNHACPSPWKQPRMPPLLTESQTGVKT